MGIPDPLGARSELVPGIDYHRLDRFSELGAGDVARLPITVKILLENVLRHVGSHVDADQALVLAGRDAQSTTPAPEWPFMPSRVLMQDLTGVPCVVDMAAMRAAAVRTGGDPARIDALVPVDLVVDHSVQVDAFGSSGAYAVNVEREYERNRERYALLRWAQQAFRGFRVVPPGMGIVHQVNLEYLATVVGSRDDGSGTVSYPDTVVGTDSHTTMVNGIGVLGFGVGGIEAESVMLGHPLSLLEPVVVGVRFLNSLPPGTTATDLVLTLTECLRAHGVVNKFVEFCGSGLASMTAADRATLSNMAPEYGATAALFPVDDQTLRYLTGSGRSAEHVALVETYARAQGLFRIDGADLPLFHELVELDLASVVPSLAGPRRPQDRVSLDGVWQSFLDVHEQGEALPAAGSDRPEWCTARDTVSDGSVVIAAITSCTNTSNPSVMIGAGLLAQKAVARGLRVPAHVKTTLAPGSRVVSDYLERAGLLAPLSALGFDLVGYGCTTCIGNSGPLADGVADKVEAGDHAVVAVLSGNRNFEGRIHPQVKAAYLASPPLVVAYALAGTIRADLTAAPVGVDQDGRDVFLSDLWPSSGEVDAAVKDAVGSDLFRQEYAHIFDGDATWRALPAPGGPIYQWDPNSTYVREPPFFSTSHPVVESVDIRDARVLVLVGDSVTTDHISPAGSIAARSPAGRYLIEKGISPPGFNTYGARRGNHEVMMRGTFAGSRLRNRLAGDVEGGVTTHVGSGELLSVFDAAQRYAAQSTPLIVIAGRDYGSGSSRDWAAKGPALLGVRAVLAESFERIHRGNLVGMGVLPLEFTPGESAQGHGLTGLERFTITGRLGAGPSDMVAVEAVAEGGAITRFDVRCRLNGQSELDQYRAGGILPMMLAGS